MAKSYIQSLMGEREKSLLVSRQHWFILARNIFLEILAIVIIIILAVVAAISFLPLWWIPAAIGAILLLIPVATMLRDILDWWNRQFLVTNRRVMQISGIFNKNVIDSSLEKVNDVKMEQSVFGRMFDYGDVEILTASELGVNKFKRIENPIRFKTAMINAKEKLERGEEGVGENEDILAMIARLDQMRQQGILTEEEFAAQKGNLLSKL